MWSTGSHHNTTVSVVRKTYDDEDEDEDDEDKYEDEYKEKDDDDDGEDDGGHDGNDEYVYYIYTSCFFRVPIWRPLAMKTIWRPLIFLAYISHTTVFDVQNPPNQGEEDLPGYM